LKLVWKVHFCSALIAAICCHFQKMGSPLLSANSVAVKSLLLVSPAACWFLRWHEKNVAYENVIVTTRSDPEAFPSALRQKRKTETKQHEKGDQGTLVSCRFSCAFSAKRGSRQMKNVRPVGIWVLTRKKYRCAQHLLSEGLLIDVMLVAKRRRRFNRILQRASLTFNNWYSCWPTDSAHRANTDGVSIIERFSTRLRLQNRKGRPHQNRPVCWLRVLWQVLL
jgi:hypothetical protein